jgi:hypothetical protein
VLVQDAISNLQGRMRDRKAADALLANCGPEKAAMPLSTRPPTSEENRLLEELRETASPMRRPNADIELALSAVDEGPGGQGRPASCGLSTIVPLAKLGEEDRAFIERLLTQTLSRSVIGKRHPTAALSGLPRRR